MNDIIYPQLEIHCDNLRAPSGLEWVLRILVNDAADFSTLDWGTLSEMMDLADRIKKAPIVVRRGKKEE